MNQDERKRQAGNAPGQQTETAQQQMQDAGQTGGIPKTLESGVRDSDQAPGRPAGATPAQAGVAADKPADRATTDRSSAAQTGAGQRSDDPPGEEDESAAESLGRAIGAPLSGEASPGEPRR